MTGYQTVFQHLQKRIFTDLKLLQLELRGRQFLVDVDAVVKQVHLRFRESACVMLNTV
jgi:hypothetical protein